MTKKRSRIRQTKTEWQKAFETYGNIKYQPWNLCLPELLHISIALIDNDFEKVKYEFIELCKIIKRKSNKEEFHGNLSAIIDFIKEQPAELEELNTNIFYFSITQIIAFYNDFFKINLQYEFECKPKYIFSGFDNLIEQKSDFTITCKFIIINGYYDNDTSKLNRKIITYDDVIAVDNRSVINATWLGISVSKNIVNHEFTELIWFFNYILIPVMQIDDTENEEKRFTQFEINDLKAEYLKYSEEFKEIPLFTVLDRPFAEIIMGFVNRSIYLTAQVIELVELHKGEIAEAVLRMLYESRLKFLWLLNKKDIILFKRFREYSSGREKLFHEKLISQSDSKDISKYKEEMDQKLRQEGFSDFEIATERGDEFEIGVDKMASELGESERLLYDSVYKRTSDIIHGNWRVIEKYHLTRSENPLHDSLLFYNQTTNKFSGLYPTYTALMFGSEIIYKFMETIDDIFEDENELYLKIRDYNEKIKRIYVNDYLPSIS